MKNKTNPETKKMLIKRIIFLIIFSLIAVGLTVYFILNNLPKEELVIGEANKNKEKNTTEKTVYLEETYDINDLEIKEFKEKYRDLEIKYYQIDGLKDNSVEVSINYNLKNDLIKLIDEVFKEDKINVDDFTIYLTINSNFANTISLSYYVYSYKNVGEGMPAEELINTTICENYDLTTGNRIKMNDIFAKNTPMR